MYRLTRRTPLSTGQKQGDIIRDGELSPSTIRKLLRSGTLARVSTPPLAETPGNWDGSLKRLEQAGVVTLEDLIMANPAKLAKVVNKTSGTIKRWQAQAESLLKPAAEKKKKGN